MPGAIEDRRAGGEDDVFVGAPIDGEHAGALALGPPATRELATRGATWSFLRYAADQLYTADGTGWQRFDNSTTAGLETVKGVYPTDPTPLFRNWAFARFRDASATHTAARVTPQS